MAGHLSGLPGQPLSDAPPSGTATTVSTDRVKSKTRTRRLGDLPRVLVARGIHGNAAGRCGRFLRQSGTGGASLTTSPQQHGHTQLPHSRGWQGTCRDGGDSLLTPRDIRHSRAFHRARVAWEHPRSATQGVPRPLHNQASSVAKQRAAVAGRFVSQVRRSRPTTSPQWHGDRRRHHVQQPLTEEPCGRPLRMRTFERGGLNGVGRGCPSHNRGRSPHAIGHPA